jgi:hypothetical protein
MLTNSFGETAEQLNPALFRMAVLLYDKNQHSKARQAVREQTRQQFGQPRVG